jgi:hypothetical protein
MNLENMHIKELNENNNSYATDLRSKNRAPTTGLARQAKPHSFARTKTESVDRSSKINKLLLEYFYFFLFNFRKSEECQKLRKERF